MATKLNKHARIILGKDEPTFTMINSDSTGLMRALNYYSQHKTYEDSKNWALEWASVNMPEIVSTLSKIHPDKITNVGYVLRCIDNGFLDEELEARMRQELSIIVGNYIEEKKEAQIAPRVRAKREEPNVMLEQFDYALDAICDPGRGTTVEALVMYPNTSHINQLKSTALKLQDEVTEFPAQYINQLTIKKYIRETLEKIAKFSNSVKADKVRKKAPRKIDPQKMVSQIVLCSEDKELNVKTLKASSIIGATKLIVWHPERRTLTAFISSNENGFLVSGRSLKNFDIEKSITKKIRKPLEMWEAIKSLSVTRMHYWLRDECKTTATPAKALIADGSMILKV